MSIVGYNYFIINHFLLKNYIIHFNKYLKSQNILI